MKSSYLVVLLYTGLCTCCVHVPHTSNETYDNYTDYELEARVIEGVVLPNLETRRHQVAIFVRSTDGFTFRCGGSIYDSFNVITAQCLFDDDLKVVIDAANIKILPGRAVIQDLEYGDSWFNHVYGYCIHRSYDPEKGSGDVAVIRLRFEWKYSLNVNSIKIAHSAMGFKGADISGYGSADKKFKDEKTRAQADGKYSLRIASVRIISYAECQKKANEIRKEEMFSDGVEAAVMAKYRDPYKPSDKVVCGDSRLTDACDLDVGGSLVCYHAKVPSLCGIISSGYGCGVGYPRFYTEIYHYAEWIKQLAKSFDTCDAIFVQRPAPPKQYYNERGGYSGCYGEGYCWKYCGSGNTWCYTKHEVQNDIKRCDTKFDCSESLVCKSGCGL